MDKVKYTGRGKFLQGVPARDMSMAEWEALDEELREAALALGLYELPQEKPKPKANEKKEDEP